MASPRPDSSGAESMTAADYIASQLELESDAREVLPYSFETCTHDLGHLRQPVYACRTCVPLNPTAPPRFGEWKLSGAAALCYSCSIQCHGDHDLVEIFEKRGVRCDCGTRALPGTRCELRKEVDGMAIDGGEDGEKDEAAEKKGENRYGQNYWGRFCSCEVDYKPEKEEGTMFQCFLGDACGEDWFHDVCVVGLGPPKYDEEKDGEAAKPEHAAGPATTANGNHTNGTDEGAGTKPESTSTSHQDDTSLPKAADSPNSALATAATNPFLAPTPPPATAEAGNDEDEDDDAPPPPGFPTENFEHFVCWACVAKNPWLKRYAGTPGFLAGVPNTPPASTAGPATTVDAARPVTPTPEITLTTPIDIDAATQPAAATETDVPTRTDIADADTGSRKRKASSTPEPSESVPKRLRTPEPTIPTDADAVRASPPAPATCKLPTLPPPTPAATTAPISLFLLDNFREHFCRCASCFPQLARHRCLLEEEETYSPPKDDDAASDAGSVLDRGEAALLTGDRVRAIEGVLAYNRMKEEVKKFLAPFAESGEAVGADAVRAWAESLKQKQGG